MVHDSRRDIAAPHSAEASGERRRVLVLGGGLAGLTTAWELSRTPALRARYEVTVLQLGWRLGGKLASGRDPERGWRNEEHGLHVWFGFYENAFALADEVLRRWRAPAGCPFRGVTDIVEPHHVAMFAEPMRGGADPYRVHRLHLPRTGHRPGHGRASNGPLAGLVGLVDLLRAGPQTLLELAGVDGTGRGPRLPEGLRRRLWPPPDKAPRLSRPLDRVADRLLDLLSAGTPAARVRLARSVRRAARLAKRALRPWFHRIGEGRRVRQALYSLDLGLALTAGLCDPQHGVVIDGDLDRIADWDLREFLTHHGGHPDAVAHSVVLAGQYDAFFQYRDGRRDQPSYEASTAIRILLRGLIGYRGAVAWMLQDGMGEAFIAPLYEVLRDQGVRFRFFHEVRRLELSEDRASVAVVHAVRQARVRSGDYEPLVTFRGQRVWGCAPDWEQLESGAALRERGVRFESRFGPRGDDVPVTFEHGVDFDEVVCALPLGVLAPDPDGHSPVRELLDHHPRVRAAVEGINLQSSIAVQLWLDRPLSDFGWRSPASVVLWGEHASVFCDMSQVLPHEGWGPDGPVCTVYLCGVSSFDEVHASSEDAEAPERARREAVARLQGQLERDAGGVFAPPGQRFDWGALHDPDGGEGPARLEAQYIRANIEPWDLCDSAVPSTASLRLEAHESGVDNLALASTWVRTGMNTTCVEGAVMSGMAAARALGVQGREIHGEDFLSRPFGRALLPSVVSWLEEVS